MRITIDIPSKVFNLVLHGEFYRATEDDFTTLMRSFNAGTILKEEISQGDCLKNKK